MAKKEPTRPEEVKTAPATQAQEAGADLSDKSEEQFAPIDIGGEHRPGDER